jgi:hypothetical protein
MLCNDVDVDIPLDLVMADIFMTHLGATLMNALKSIGACEWRLHADDTFLLVGPNTKVDAILSILNNFHSSIKLTHENEAINSLLFLDVRVTRSPERRTFKTII